MNLWCGRCEEEKSKETEKEQNNKAFRGQRTLCCLVSDTVCVLENEEKELYAKWRQGNIYKMKKEMITKADKVPE